MPLAARTLPVTTFGGGISAAGVLSLPGVEAACIHVDKGPATGTEDGTRQDPFHTVAAGLAAAALIANVNNPVVVLVYPGVYAEDGLIMGADYVSLVGIGGRDAVRIHGTNQTVLTITAELTSVWGITFEQTHLNSDIVNINTGTTTRCELHECHFHSYLNGTQAVRVTDGGALFKDCWLSVRPQWMATQPALVSVASANNDIVVDGCVVEGPITSDGSVLRIEHSTINGQSSTGMIVFSTGGEIYIRHCYIYQGYADGIYFSAQPNTAVIHDNDIYTAANPYGINATVAITGLDIAGNTMIGGMHGNVSHVDSIRYVANPGTRNKDFYKSLQHALDSCTFDDCVIKLLDDLTLTASPVPPGRVITVDGNGFHLVSLSGAALVFNVTPGCALTVVDAVVDGRFFLAQGSSLIILRSELRGQIRTQVGTTEATFYVVRSKVDAGLGTYNYQWAIRLADAAEAVIKRSYIKGAPANAAIYYDNVTCNNLKVEHSVVWHGSGAANLPIGRSAAQTPDYCSHHDAYNTDPLAGGWLTNLIAAAERYNSYDVQTDY